MKKILYLLLVVVLSSCTDMLELDPHQSLSPNVAYATYDDCNNAARGIYLRARGLYTGKSVLVADAYCDNLISFSKGRQSSSYFRNWNITSGNGFMWLDPYKVIVNCNLLIDNMKIPADEADKFNQLKGEALAMRALMHYELVRLYGKSYTSASATDLGVPYIKITDPSNKPARETVKSNFVNILADLNAAYDLMTKSENLDNSRLSKRSVAAILSRVCLYMGDYDNTITYGEKALVNGDAVCPLDEFSKVWHDTSDKGVLFKSVVTEKEDLIVGNYFNQFLGGEYKSEFVAPKSFATLYDASSDVRFSSYFQKSSFQGSEAYHIIKYVGLADDSHTRNKVSLKLIRVAEIKLNIAEASLRKATKDEAKANLILNELLTARLIGYTHADKSGSALLAEVMKQRRLELALEWDRFTTLKRLNLDCERTPGEGDLSDGTGRVNQVETLKHTDHRWQLPLRTSEIDANANIVQNPGY